MSNEARIKVAAEARKWRMDRGPVNETGTIEGKEETYIRSCC